MFLYTSQGFSKTLVVPLFLMASNQHLWDQVLLDHCQELAQTTYSGSIGLHPGQ